jgi:hypothetical protein
MDDTKSFDIDLDARERLIQEGGFSAEFLAGLVSSLREGNPPLTEEDAYAGLYNFYHNGPPPELRRQFNDALYKRELERLEKVRALQLEGVTETEKRVEALKDYMFMKDELKITDENIWKTCRSDSKTFYLYKTEQQGALRGSRPFKKIDRLVSDHVLFRETFLKLHPNIRP